jgi:hypothetical protein
VTPKPDSWNIHSTSPIGDPGEPERAPLDRAAGQSRGNQERLAELEAAIANVTRLLAKTDDAETAGELVAERRAMRGEVEVLRREAAGNVRDIDAKRRR